MKFIFLVPAIVLAIISSVLGVTVHLSGNDNWQGSSLNGNVDIKVYQWCDIDEFNYYYWRVLEVTDYDTPAEITARPDEYIAALFDVRSNGDLKLAMKGFRIYDVTGSVVNYDQYIKEKYWSLYQWSPSSPNPYFSDSDVGEKRVVGMNETISDDDMLYLRRDERCLKYKEGSQNIQASFGVGLKIILDKAFPAGKYTFEYTIYVFPTVTFPSG